MLVYIKHGFPPPPPTPKTISDLCCEGVGFLLSVHLKTKCSELPIYACLWFTSIPRALWTGACAVPLWWWCHQKQQHFRGWRENPLGWAGMGFVCELPFCFYIVSVHAQLWLNMILKRVTMILVLPRLTTHTQKDVRTHVKHTHMHACICYKHCVVGSSQEMMLIVSPVWSSFDCLAGVCVRVGTQQLLFR